MDPWRRLRRSPGGLPRQSGSGFAPGATRRKWTSHCNVTARTGPSGLKPIQPKPTKRANAVLECWSAGVLECCGFPSLHHSITPFLEANQG